VIAIEELRCRIVTAFDVLDSCERLEVPDQELCISFVGFCPLGILVDKQIYETGNSIDWRVFDQKSPRDEWRNS
jgi:hypothetical protein